MNAVYAAVKKEFPFVENKKAGTFVPACATESV
jgi:hypothetical protein